MEDTMAREDSEFGRMPSYQRLLLALVIVAVAVLAMRALVGA